MSTFSDPGVGMQVPRLLRSRDARLDPLEKFVLTKIDGRRTISDLAVLVGVDVARLVAVTDKLARLRMIAFDEKTSAQPSPVIIEAHTTPDRPSSRPTSPSFDDPFDRPTHPSDPPLKMSAEEQLREMVELGASDPPSRPPR